MTTYDWPSIISPRRVVCEPYTPSLPTGRTITGAEQIHVADAGFFVLVYDEIPLVSLLQKRAWRLISVQMRGRVSTVRAPILERKPPTTVATVDLNAARGDPSITLHVSAGEAPVSGMHFTVNDRLYRIRTVSPQTSPNYQCDVFPPVRDAITAGATANFATPTLICRAQTDVEMQTGADDYAGRTLAKVQFHEATIF